MANEEISIEENSNNSQSIVLKERFEIDYNMPLPELNTNNALAYQVKDKTMPTRDLFALICNNNTPPRMSILPYLRSISHPSLLQLIEYGVVTYSVHNSKNVALIYEKPMGPKLLQISEKAYKEIKFDPNKIKKIFLSLLSTIEMLKGYNITHRSIRADNIFFKDNNYDSIVLGDCAACFPAFAQPTIYETIESAVALPQARGDGIDKNDIYAAAVTILTLLKKSELYANLSSKDIIKLKLARSSFVFLNQEFDYHKSLSPLFSNTLDDIEENRWTYVQAYNFIEGKNTNFNNSYEKAKKSLTINGNKFYNPKEVAYNLANNPAEAYELIKNDKVKEWIKSGLENEQLLQAVTNLVKNDFAVQALPALTVAKICVLIAPSMPIMLEETRIFPNGGPKTIFYALKTEANLTNCINIFSSELIKLWYNQQISLRSPANLTEFSLYMKKKDIGYGIERIMYDFDEDLPCLSSVLGDDFVNTPGKILRTIDRNIKNNAPKLYDNAIIAYLRCKMGKKIEGVITDLNNNRVEVKNLAILRLYTNLQNKFGPAELVNLTQAFTNFCLPIIKKYHNLQLQKTMEKEVIKVAKSGKLQNILDIIEDKELMQKDNAAYNKIIEEAIVLNAEKNRIINSTTQDEEMAQSVSIKLAMILGFITIIISFITSLIYWVF